MSERSWLILTDGYLTSRNAKTAHGVIQYSPDRVAAVLDGEHAGRDAGEVLPRLGRRVPIVGSLDEGLSYEPTSLLLGVATPGGWMPAHWRDLIIKAITSGLAIVNGLHTFLKDDPELVRLAEEHGVRLWDVRDPPADIPLFSGKSLEIPQSVVLTVGTDCAVGKKTAALELTKAGNESGRKCEFVATGQTGILIAGRGIAVDRVISDFLSGAAEKLVCEADPDSEVLVVEGQGGMWHPAYASVTVGLLHGCAPHALVLCHQAGRTAIEEPPYTKLPPLPEMVSEYEHAAALLRPAKVACVTVNCQDLDDDATRVEIERVEDSTGLPAGDVLRGDAAKLWAAVAAAL
jgi:D-glutamate N-acetyltransferase